MSRGLHRQHRHWESPLSQLCWNSPSQRTDPVPPAGKNRRRRGAAGTYSKAKLPVRIRRKTGICHGRSSLPFALSAQLCIWEPPWAEQVRLGLHSLHSRCKSQRTTAASHPNQGAHWPKSNREQGQKAQKALTSTKKNPKPKSQQDGSKPALHPLRCAAAGQAPAAGISTARQPGRLNDVQRTLRLPFMFPPVCWGQKDEGILYPENTQLF